MPDDGMEINEVLMNMIGEIGLKPVTNYPVVPRISTGSLSLDWATSGGFPCNNVSVLWGEEASGKSTTIYNSAAITLRENPGASVAYIDTENVLDWSWPKKLGVDMTRFVYWKPSSIEETMNLLTELIRKNIFWMICVDSVNMPAGLTTQSKQLGDVDVAMEARVIGDWFKRHTGTLAASKSVDIVTGERLSFGPAVVMTTHVTEAIGVMYGSNERQPGGRKLRHGPALRIRMSGLRKANYKMTDDVLQGVEHSGKILKNKVGPPQREFSFLVRQDHPNYGIDLAYEVGSLAMKLNILQNRHGEQFKTGTPFFAGEEVPINSYETSEKKDKNMHKLILLLYDNDEWFGKLYPAVRQAILNSQYDFDTSLIAFDEDELLENDQDE